MKAANENFTSKLKKAMCYILLKLELFIRIKIVKIKNIINRKENLKCLKYHA